jgi:hypothetical protein
MFFARGKSSQEFVIGIINSLTFRDFYVPLVPKLYPLQASSNIIDGQTSKDVHFKLMYRTFRTGYLFPVVVCMVIELIV